jgi:hypothetical protein
MPSRKTLESPPRKKRGIILVLVLLLLALCGSVASQIAAQVIRLSGQAALAQQELQQRWAIVSIRRSLFKNAPDILEQSTTANLSILLGSDRYSVLLQDESSKLPLRHLLRTGPQERIKNLIRNLGNGGEPLKTLSTDASQLAQIFEQPSSMNPLDRFSEWNRYAEKLTLWSDGRLNILSCSPETLDALWKFRFGRAAPKQIHTVRGDAIKQLNPNEVRGERTTSTRFSLTDSMQSFGLS